MADFPLGAAGLVLAMVALGLVRILYGRARSTALWRHNCSALAELLLLAQEMNMPAAVDVALILALLAAFVSVAFFTSAARSDVNRE